MIAALLACQLLAQQPVEIAYTGVPREVVSVTTYAWREGEAPARAESRVTQENGLVRVTAMPGQRSLVTFARADGAYLLDGPFVWPSAAATHAAASGWRRTIHMRAPPDVPSSAAITWLSGDPDLGDPWPRAFWSGGHAVDLWGLPLAARGVILAQPADRLWWTIVFGPQPRDLQASAWGRLILVRDGDLVPDAVTVKLARPEAPALRHAALQVDTIALSDAHALAIGPGTLWVYGDGVAPGSWIELRSARAGPDYLALDDIAAGPSGIPERVSLDDPAALDGTILSAQGEPASAALVTLFRFVDPASPRDRQAHARRRQVFVAECVAGADGAFHLDGLGDADYEIAAWHPQLGRATMPIPKGAGSISIRLASAGQARGRIVSGGKPIAGVDVISLPDAAAFQRAAAFMDVKGGDARTGADGRFAVALAQGGGGELRVGGGSYPIKRIPLPRTPLPLLELSDVDLGASIDLVIVLDQDPGCDVRATGPVGEMGLQVLLATRAGPGLFRLSLPEAGLWEFTLGCDRGKDDRLLAPAYVQVTAAQTGRELHFAVK